MLHLLRVLCVLDASVCLCVYACVVQIYSSVNLDLPGGFGGLLPLARLYGQVKQTNEQTSNRQDNYYLVRH